MMKNSHFDRTRFGIAASQRTFSLFFENVCHCLRVFNTIRLILSQIGILDLIMDKKTFWFSKEIAVVTSFLTLGTLNSVALTFVLARKSEGRDGISHYFNHSFVLTLLTLLGKAMNLIPYLIKKYSGSYSSG